MTQIPAPSPESVCGVSQGHRVPASGGLGCALTVTELTRADLIRETEPDAEEMNAFGSLSVAPFHFETREEGRPNAR